MIGVGFVLSTLAEAPEPSDVLAALEPLGSSSTLASEGDETSTVVQLGDGAVVFVSFMPVPHPELDGLMPGPMSPPVDGLQASTSHLLVVLQAELEPPDHERTLFRALAAVTDATGGVAARIGGGANYFRPDVLGHVANALPEDEPPPSMFVVGLTAAAEPGDRVSFLTHGLDRYGREEFLVTAPIDGTGAVDFVWMMADWARTTPSKQFPTGDTVGRTQDERIEIQRVAHPFEEDATVVRLDLDA